ncbi:MAG: hypothetical protein GY832_22465, partial [Chloroflexi bacterium]|nr:hypothetical protein [Chloroflexota bacterium]
PRMERATAGEVSSVERDRTARETHTIAAEAAYRQLIGNTIVDVNGPEAETLRNSAKRWRTEFDQIYGPSIAQKSMATPAANLGVGAGASASISAPVPPLSSRPTPSAPTVPVEAPEQRKEKRRMQLVNHWKQVQNFLATCPETNLVERQKAYDDYLAALAQFEFDFLTETLSANTARCR